MENNSKKTIKMDERLRRHELGFLELVNKPTKEELEDYYAKSYYQNESGNFRKEYSRLESKIIEMRVEQKAIHISELIRNGEEIIGSLLDVGCGEGYVLNHHKKMGWKVSGIDFSTVGVKQMNANVAQYVEQGDVYELLFSKIRSNQKYDIVWLGNILEHVLSPIELLNSIQNLVYNNSILVVTVPNDGNRYHESLYEDGLIPERWWINIPDHLSYFTSDSLKRTAEATGWECLSIQGDFPIDWYLANENSNYVKDKFKGANAHKARLKLEFIIGLAGSDKANQFYEALACVNLGRNITAYLN